MIPRQWMRVAAVLTFVATNLSVSNACAVQEPGPGVVQALLVGDSKSSLGESVKDDISRLSRALSSAFEDHPSRLRIHPPLTGSAVSASAITSFLKGLESGREDTLFFYFVGHGDVRTELGHVLLFTNPDETGRKSLRRVDLIAEMKAKNPRLIVVLTDCCGRRAGILPANLGRSLSTLRAPDELPPTAEAPSKSGPPRPKWAVAGCLFLQHRGVVDINSCCPAQVALRNDPDQGAIWTGAFAGLLDRSNFRLVDKNNDGFIAWDEFYPELDRRAQQSFASLQLSLMQTIRWAQKQRLDPEDVLSEDEKQALFQATQKTWTFSILPFLRVGVRVVDSSNGLRLAEVYPGTPASSVQGLKQGVAIVGVGDNEVSNERDFARAVDASPGNRPLVLKVKEPGTGGARSVSIELRDNHIMAGVRSPVTATLPGAPVTPPLRRQ
jgi:Caspase domain